MLKKISFLMCIVSVLVLSGVASATGWSNAGGDQSFVNAANWDGVAPTTANAQTAEIGHFYPAVHPRAGVAIISLSPSSVGMGRGADLGATTGWVIRRRIWQDLATI